MEKYTLKSLKKYMTHHGLIKKGWSYRINKRKESAGVTKYLSKSIEISHYYINSPKTTKDNIINTILHEIAHSLTRGHGHDSTWKKKFIEIGGNGLKRCHNFSTDYINI